MPPLSARRHPPALPPILSDLVRLGNAALEGAVRRHHHGRHDPPRPVPVGPDRRLDRPIVEAADAFLASLDDAQRDAVTFPVDADEWRTWCNVHIYLRRHGLLLDDLRPGQRAAALELVRASLSARGFDDVRDVMRFNEVLREITGSDDEYGEWMYFLSIFGTPSTTEPWGWQLDGHHLNLHCFVLGRPDGAHPGLPRRRAVPRGVRSHAGLRVFDAEEREAWPSCARSRPSRPDGPSSIPRSSAPTCHPSGPSPSTAR